MTLFNPISLRRKKQTNKDFVMRKKLWLNLYLYWNCMNSFKIKSFFFFLILIFNIIKPIEENSQLTIVVYFQESPVLYSKHTGDKAPINSGTVFRGNQYLG